MEFLLGLIIPLAVISIPITAIILSYKRKTQNVRVRELELQKEILQLELEKQDKQLKLLEEENRKYDRILTQNILRNDKKD